MSAFENALSELLKFEGGYTNHPNDRGSHTNLGITIGTLSRFLGREATVDEVKALTPALVAPIYKKLYWDPAFLDLFPPKLAHVMFNQIVLRGEASAIKTLQNILSVPADGIVGPSTLSALGRMPVDKLVFNFLRESHHSYIKICQKDPSQLVFLAGWSNRIFDLMATSLK